MSKTATALQTAFEPVEYDPFAGGELAEVVPTTEAQREIWLADQLSPEASLSFNLSVSLRLLGDLDIDALQLALQQLVDRHDALRTCIVPDGQHMAVLQHSEATCHVTDLGNLDMASRNDAVARHARASVETPFTLDEPMFRSELLRLDAQEHLLTLCTHHIVCDGWSWWVLVRELGALYGLHSNAGPAPTPASSFADFALAEAAADADPADEAYWLSQFETEPPVLELPTDRPRPALRSFTSAREDHVLDETVLEALRNMGGARRTSLFAILLTSFSSLLSRLTGQHDVIVGIPAAGQPAVGAEDLVGHCVNTLPLRFSNTPDESFADALDAAQATLLDALEHQRHTFGTLLKKLKLRRDPARMPLVSVLFNLDQALDHEGGAFPGLAMEFDSNPRSFESFEMFVNAVQCGGQLRLECQYNTDLFDAATIRRWLRAYETLLRGAIADSNTALGKLPLVDTEARMELEALQPPPTEYDRTRRMHQHFELQCDAGADRIALETPAGIMTYAQLEARANRIAHVLREHGVHRGALVGLALDRGADMLAALIGILKAGAGYVPLDPGFPPDRLAYMAADAGLALLLTTRTHAGNFDLRGRPVLLLDEQAPLFESASASRLPDDDASAGAEDPAYVIYTSGSTGRPKGVIVPHRAVANFLASMALEPGLGEDDCLLAVTTLSFDIAVLELMLPLAVGGCVVMADRETAADGHAMRALLERSGATAMQGTPSSWRLLVDAGWQGTADFKALCGGEPMPGDLAAALLERCGSVWNVYGPTETTVWSTCARVQTSGEGAPDIHIGRPITNTSVWILDPGGELCPHGVPGEICIGGEGVTSGYLGRPELTKERFVADRYSNYMPHADGSTQLLYRTGDRGRWRPDGNLEHMGRLDHQVKVRGYRIELGEIESNIAAREEITRTHVIVREDRVGDQRIVAYVVARPGAVIDEGVLREYLHSLLPSYMVPQHFIALDSIPLLPNGKVDRNALPPPGVSEEAQPPEPDDKSTDPRVHYLSQIWSEMLGLPAGANDNFFELGGHSMLAVQMASRVERETGHRIKLIRLGADTLAQVASNLPQQEEPEIPAAHESRITHGLRRLFGFGARPPRHTASEAPDQ